MDNLTNEQIIEALKRCVGVYDIERDCERCPLYEDHYCVDTLCSLIKERMGHHENQAGDGKSI